jgi:hypothetical protein
MFVGSQNRYPETYSIPTDKDWPYHIRPWMANEEAYRVLWDEISEMIDVKWDFQMRLLDLKTIGLQEDDGSERSKRLGNNLQWTAMML